jgi:hypothetical protein
VKEAVLQHQPEKIQEMMLLVVMVSVARKNGKNMTV